MGLVGVLGDDAAEREQGDGVGKDHQLVEHVCKLPDEVVGEQASHEDEDQGDDGEDGQSLLAKEVLDIEAGEEVLIYKKEN